MYRFYQNFININKTRGGFYLKNIGKIVMVIIGTAIGAGFASGKEIYIFFSQYGKWGIIGIILASSLLGSFVIGSLLFIYRKPIQDYYQWAYYLTKNKTLAKVLQKIVSLFSLVSFYIMVAGFTAYVIQNFSLEENLLITYGISSLFVGVCIIVVKYSAKGVIKLNTIMVPIIMIFMLIIGVQKGDFTMQNIITLQGNFFETIISAILYMSYNSILLVPVLIGMKQWIKNKKQIFSIGVFCTIIFGLMAIIIQAILSRGIFYATNLELPILAIMKEFGKFYIMAYGIIIVTAILTSAVSAQFGILENVKHKKIILIFIAITAILTSKLGFTQLVKMLYPIFGILGLIQILYLFLNLRKKA